MSNHIVYALVDPDTLHVRYVGKTSRTAKERLTHHLGAANRGVDKPLYAWIRGLKPRTPLLVVLQEVQGVVGRVRVPDGYENAIAAAETKWMKRFERSHLFNTIPKISRAYRRLVNQDAILEKVAR